MSAIDFRTSVVRKPDPKGDRVVITLDGKVSLEFAMCANNSSSTTLAQKLGVGRCVFLSCTAVMHGTDKAGRPSKNSDEDVAK